jgi:diguanylate cyclase
MYSILPHDDPNQALRMRRFFMAFGSYIMWIILVSYCYEQGWTRISLRGILGIYAAIIDVNMVLYSIFRTGLNKRFKDPSLTMLQMLLALFGVMVFAYFTEHVRGIALVLFMVIFIFGVFRLQLRQFIVLALYSLIGYGCVIVLLLINHQDTINFREEFLYWVVLASVLSWFSFIGSYINHLREKLVKANILLGHANERIRQSAIMDELTGAFNRRRMMEILQREKSLADRGGPPFSLCIFDLDNFKHVNDTYGHLAGDMVLRILIHEIKGNIRDQDYIARYGGEEFVIILAHPEMEESLACAERLKELASRLRYPGLPDDFSITISMGVTRYWPRESIDSLIGRADAALYQAKMGGKNRIALEQPPLPEAIQA